MDTFENIKVLIQDDNNLEKVKELLQLASKLQTMIINCEQAANGIFTEFTNDFISHLIKICN